jgi:hypothetical protein
MYQVTIYNGDESTIIHNPFSRDRTLTAGKIVQADSFDIDSFSFTILPDNPGWDLITPHATRVTVENVKQNRVEFSGRVLTEAVKMSSSGKVTMDVVCESNLGYLQDTVCYVCDSTIQVEEETIDDWWWYGALPALEYACACHNQQVDDRRKIALGDVSYLEKLSSGVDYTDPDNGYQNEPSFQSTYDFVSDIYDEFGGYLDIIDNGEHLVLNWYSERPGASESTVEIRLGKNLQKITRDIDSSDLVTRIYPVGTASDGSIVYLGTPAGTKIETTAADDLVNLKYYATDTYIDDVEAQTKYGIISKRVEFDAENAEDLRTQAEAWFESNSARFTESYSLTALDLSLLGLEPEDFQRGYKYRVVNELIGTDVKLEIIKKTINIVEPQKSTISMGDVATQFTSLVSALQKSSTTTATLAAQTSKETSSAKSDAASAKSDAESAKADAAQSTKTTESTVVDEITAADDVEVTSLSLRRVGNVVQMVASLTADTKVTSLGTLAATWRPAMTVMLSNGTVSTAGEIKLTTATSGTITIGGTWLA